MNLNKKVYRNLERGKTIRPEYKFNSGFGYTIIPNDIERSDYIKIVYQTGYVMMIDTDNEIHKDVKVPNNLIDKLRFPQESGQYGDLVSWTRVEKFNQLKLDAIFNKPGQYYPYLENVSVRKYNSNNFEIVRSVDGDTPLYLVSVDSEDQIEGGIHFKSKSSEKISEIRILTDGTMEMSADEGLIGIFEEYISIQVGTEKDKISTLKIDGDSGLSYLDRFGNSVKISDGLIEVDSDKIILCNGQSPAVLGDKLINLLTKLIGEVAKITVLANGTPSSPPLNAASIAAVASELQEIVSSQTYLR